LKPGGVFAFSIETTDEGTHCALSIPGRYAHSTARIRVMVEAEVSGLTEVSIEPAVLRMEAGKPVTGNILALFALV
jgi:predicted TPR repeat methyltransferase